MKSSLSVGCKAMFGGLFASVGISLAVLSPTPAMAVTNGLSPGCAQLNGTQSNTSGTGTGFSTAGFNAGETITLTVTGGGQVGLFVYPNFVIPAQNANSTYTFTQDVPAGTFVAISYFVGSPGQSASWNCRGVATQGGSPSNTLQTVQASIAPLIATVSQQAISSSIDSGINDAFSQGGTPTNFSGTGGFINFAATPKSEIEQRTDDAFSALAYAKTGKQPAIFKAPAKQLDREWSIWADIRGTGFKANDTSPAGNNSAGTQYNITAGVGRKLNTETLIGVFVGYEGFKHDIASLGATLKGNGQTIGSYFARRLGSQLRFDAWLGWSNVNYSASAGATTGSFIGSRWMANTGLTYTQTFGPFTHEPSAKIYVLWDSQRAWTDSAGTAQAARNFTAGRTAIGDQISRTFVLANGMTLTPSVGFYGDWRFQTNTAIPTATPVANISAGWSARATAGLSTKLSNGSTLSLNGEYGGIGANYKIWTGNARAVIPF